MIDLKSHKIRGKIQSFCTYIEKTVKEKDILYMEDWNQKRALEEVAKIRQMLKDSQSFSVAFVGEYASGKSTIVNILTGSDLAVSSDVSTQEVSKIAWNDITIIDTPGLGSGNKEHDKITEEWIAAASLLVYVITPDLFTSHSIDRFKEMLDIFKKDHSLMLVMNMTDKEENPIDNFKIALQKAIDPRLLDDYYPSFISARNWLDSQNIKYPEQNRNVLKQKSNFDSFIEILNKFVLDKKEKASLSAPLTMLMSLSRKMSFKNEFDKEMSLLDMKISTYEQKLVDLRFKSANIRQNISDKCHGAAGDIIALLGISKTLEADANKELENLCTSLSEVEMAFKQNIEQIIKELREEDDKLNHSQLYADVETRIRHSAKLKNIFIHENKELDKGRGAWQKMNEAFTDINSVLGLNLSKDVQAILSSGNVFSASSKLLSMIDKDKVLEIGHLFGHKFRPWEAVKLSTKLSQAVPLLNVVGVAFEFWMRSKEKKKAEEQARQIREFKEQVNSHTSTIAKTTVVELEQMLYKPIEAVLAMTLESLKSKKDELMSYSKENAETYKELEIKINQGLLIYDEIYETQLTKRES